MEGRKAERKRGREKERKGGGEGASSHLTVNGPLIGRILWMRTKTL